MATVQIGNTFKLNGANLYVLGNPLIAGVGAISIKIQNDAAFSGSIAVQAKSENPADTTYVNHIYAAYYLNGTVSDGTIQSGTAITTTSNIIVPASGLFIALNVTYTSGSATVYWTPVVGPSVL